MNTGCAVAVAGKAGRDNPTTATAEAAATNAALNRDADGRLFVSLRREEADAGRLCGTSLPIINIIRDRGPLSSDMKSSAENGVKQCAHCKVSGPCRKGRNYCLRCERWLIAGLRGVPAIVQKWA